MPWPMSQDYNEAIQDPAQCFADAELQKGEAVTNAMGIPIPCSGNFAAVYAMNCGPNKWAVKCFTRQIPGLKERYAAVSKYLQQVSLPFMVDFRFLERGIRVGNDWYPILKMQWVEGLALNTFVRENLDKPQILDALCQIWLKLASRLREANLAHCDLQHGNVIMVQGTTAGKLAVKLVDYDGMCVPALEMLKSIELGHPAYQHPQRLREGTYGLEIDRFPHLVIYTAIRALMVGGKALWQKYDNGDNLLFRQTDLAAPRNSALFRELLQLNNPEVKKLAQALAIASANPIERVPLLDQLVEIPKPPPAEQAITATQPRRTGVGKIETTPLVRRQPTGYRRKGKGGLALAAFAGVVVLALIAAGALLFLGRRPTQGSKSAEIAQAATKTTRATPKAEPTRPSMPPTTKRRTKGKGFDFGDLVPKFDPPPQTTPIPEQKPDTDPRPKVDPAEPAPKVGSRKAGVLEGHTGKVTGVAFSGDGKFVASCSEDKTVRQWDASTGTENGQYEGNQKLTDEAVALSSTSDGKFLCAFSKFEVTIYDFQTRKQLHGFHQTDGRVPYVGMVYDPRNNDRMINAYSNGGMELLTFEKGAYSWRGIGPRRGTISALATSADGRFFFVGTAEGPLEIWDMQQLRHLGSATGHKGGVRGLAGSPDGKLLVSSGADNTVRLWATETGNEIRQLQGHTGEVLCVAFSPDGRRIVTGGDDKSLRLWDVQTGQEFRTFRNYHSGAVACVAFSPDGKTAASGSADRTVRLWKIPKLKDQVPEDPPVVMKPKAKTDPKDLAQPKPKTDTTERTGVLQGHTGKVTGILFSADGKFVASSGEDKTVRQWNTAAGKESGRYEGLSDAVLGLTPAPDGKSLCGFTKLALGAWDFATRTSVQDFQGFNKIMEFRQQADPASISSAVYDPRNRRLGVGFADGVDSFVFRGNSFTGQNFAGGRGGAVTHLICSADGKQYFTGSPDGTLTIWDAEQRALVRSIAAHKGAIRALAASPDGKLLLTSGADSTVRLWEVETSKQLRQFLGHAGEVLGVAFSPNSRRTVTAGADKTVRLWDARTGREIRAFKGHTDAVTCVAVSPDGKTAVSGSADQTIRLWQLPP